MRENKNGSLLNNFLASTATINGIKFSQREIDVLSCLLGGRTAKKIASLLSLSARTVENYIYNIRLKLECNSRESIIDFIEQSDKFLPLKEHYSNLLIQSEFEKSLKEIQKLDIKKNTTLIYWEGRDTQKSFIYSLQRHLKLAGFTIFREVQKDNPNSLSFPETDHIVSNSRRRI